MGPGVGYVHSYGSSSPPLQTNYFQPPGGSGDMMAMGFQHSSSLFLQQPSLGVLSHGPPIARPLLPLEYLQQGPVPRNNPVGQPGYHQNRTHSQADSPMAGVQVQSPVPSSWQQFRPWNGHSSEQWASVKWSQFRGLFLGVATLRKWNDLRRNLCC